MWHGNLPQLHNLFAFFRWCVIIKCCSNENLERRDQEQINLVEEMFNENLECEDQKRINLGKRILGFVYAQ